MLKGILMSLVLMGMLSAFVGCQKDEIRVHQERTQAPMVTQQDTVVQ